MTSSPIYPQFEIANGATTSGELDLYGSTLCGLILPAAFTGTSISFTVSNKSTADSGTFVPLYDSTNTIVGCVVTQGRAYKLAPADFAGWRYVKLVSGSAEAAARTVLAAVRHVQ